MTNATRHNHTDDTFELLSAYLDDALDVVERRRADTLLRDCAACAVDLDELRVLHQTLRTLPVPMPKRSFTLDPAQVRPRMRLFPILRFASFVSAMLLVVILGIDTLGGSQPHETAATFQAPAAAPAPEMLRQSATEAPFAQQDAPLAAGAAPEPTSVAALSAPAAAPPPAETADAAALASGAPEATMESGARAAKTPEEGTEAPAEAAGGETQNALPTEEAASVAAAVPTEEAAADVAPGTTVVAAGSGGGSGTEPAQPLTNSDTSSPDRTLEQSQAQTASAQQPANPWRLPELILGIIVIVLAGATWWTARQRL